VGKVEIAVATASSAPALGERPPASRNKTSADFEDPTDPDELAAITSSEVPDPDLYRMTVAEALVLAKKAGADPVRVREALKGGFADSRILELHGQRMIDGDFEPGGKCTTQRKDMDQALELAAELGFTMPATSLNRDLYDIIINAEMGDLDHAALIKAIDPDT